MNRHQLGDHVWCVPHGEERLRLPGVVAEIGMAEGRFNGSYVVLLDDGFSASHSYQAPPQHRRSPSSSRA